MNQGTHTALWKSMYIIVVLVMASVAGYIIPEFTLLTSKEAGFAFILGVVLSQLIDIQYKMRNQG